MVFELIMLLLLINIYAVQCLCSWLELEKYFVFRYFSLIKYYLIFCCSTIVKLAIKYSIREFTSHLWVTFMESLFSKVFCLHSRFFKLKTNNCKFTSVYKCFLNATSTNFIMFYLLAFCIEF